MNKQLGAVLRAAREQHGVEQHELAELLGIKRCMVSKIERGVRTLSATEFLTLGLLFPDWFETQVADLVDDLKADLACRLRQYLGSTKDSPLAYAKRDWLKVKLRDLEGEETIIA